MPHTDADQFAAEWAAKTGKSKSEIYIPEALREPVADTADTDEEVPAT